MADGDSRKCPRCGETIASGQARCPQGHEVPARPEETTGLESDAFDGIRELLREEPRAYLNTLYECRPCRRLIEAQTFHERRIAPRFCPWCGKPVGSILGRELDGYRIEDVISQGGFGIIYLASNIAQPAMKAAIKFLRPEMYYHQPELIKIFIEEARLTEAIGQICWNIVRISNVREKPWPYFFMEYLRGSTMESVVEGIWPKRIPLPECKGYLRGIAKALAATHSHGRIHRDLKPGNIMVIKSQEISQPEERIKLLDFGLAVKIASRRREPAGSRISGEITTGSMDSPIQSAGTPEYMAPEAFDGINEFAGDIYSFGVTSYEILTGERPWKDPSIETERYSYWRDCHRKEPPRPIRDLRPDVPNWLARVIAQCLEKDPRKRIPDAGVLIRRLREPLPFRLKLAGAAVALVFGVLLYAGLRERPIPATAAWSDGEVRLASPPVLYVRPGGPLADRTVRMSLQRNQKIREWTAAPRDAVACQLQEDGSLEVKIIQEEPPLLGNFIRIAGTGEDAAQGKSLFFRSEIQVLEDREAPKIGILKCRDGKGQLLELKPGNKVNSRETELVVDIAEPCLRKVSLRVQKGAADPGRELRMDLDRESGLYSAGLAVLKEDGTYRCRVRAVDLAGNESETGMGSGAIEFVVDNSADFNLNPEALIARNRAHYRFSIVENKGAPEKISAIEVLSGEKKERVDREVLVAEGDIADAPDLADPPGEDRLKPVQSLDSLSAQGKYFLAVPLPGGPPGELDFSYDLEVKDDSFPPNAKSLRLTGKRPAPIRREDLREISFQYTDLVSKNLSSKSIPESCPLTRFPGRLKSITVPFRQGTVVRAEKLPGTKSRPLFGPDSVILEAPALEENRENRLILKLYDPLDTLLEVPLSFFPDTQVPEIREVLSQSGEVKIPLTSSPSECHQVQGGDEIRIVVTSSEPLQEIRIADKDTGKSIEISGASAGRTQLVFESLKDLDLGEGSHSLEIGGKDLAGLDFQPYPVELRLNSKAPEIRPANIYRTDPAGILQIKSQDSFLLDVSDRNGVSFKDSTYSIDARDGSTIDQGAVESTTEGAVDARGSIPLRKLPPRFEGSLRVVIRDLCGKGATKKLPFRFESEVRWKEEVEFPEGLVWIKFDTLSFYITKTEISNKVFRHPSSIGADGLYRDPVLRKAYKRPRYWGEKGEFPSFLTPGGEKVPGDDFPVVGISPAEAEQFGRAVFGTARLPTWEEWKSAARIDNPDGKYPWKAGSQETGKDWFNYREARRRPKSLLKDHRYEGMMVSGEKDPRPYISPVEVSWDLFPKDLRERFRFPRVLHLMGNVGELVLLDPEKKSYGIAGGDYSTKYEETGIGQLPLIYASDELNRGPRNGFRLVLPIDEAPQDFQKKAVIPQDGGSR